jgi:hypothetical protein
VCVRVVVYIVAAVHGARVISLSLALLLEAALANYQQEFACFLRSFILMLQQLSQPHHNSFLARIVYDEENQFIEPSLGSLKKIASARSERARERERGKEKAKPEAGVH